MCYSFTSSTKILTLTIVTFLFISVGILCTFAMVPDVYILLSPEEEEAHSYREVTDVHNWQYIHQKPLYATILLCLSNTSKKQHCKIIAL